jgi:predicted DNA-binding protein
MPPELKEKIQQVAEMDGRTMSGWARHVLEKAAEMVIDASNKPPP